MSADSGTLPMEAEHKRQELEESNEMVHELTKQLNRVIPIQTDCKFVII